MSLDQILMIPGIDSITNPYVIATAVDSGETPLVPIDYTDADGDWRAFEFLTSGTLTVTKAGLIEYLLVGGGGGGGANRFSGAGGGGAGGMLTGSAEIAIDTYSIVIGAGGPGGGDGVNGTTGNASTAIGLTANGGGGGAGVYSTVGLTGGCGGGASGSTVVILGGTGNQGGGGGNSFPNASSPNRAGGGGGGKSVNGTNATIAQGGNGGDGLASSIRGSSVTYAGGGGGSSQGGAYGTGGTGGGGNATGTTGVAGTANRGGGGGAASSGAGCTGGAGGSGVVIVRFKYFGPTNSVAPVIAVEPPVNISPASPNGNLVVGQTLTITAGTWSGLPVLTYQWQRDTGGGFANIGGATSSTYLLDVADENADIRVVETATNAGGSASANSSSIGPIELFVGALDSLDTGLEVAWSTGRRLLSAYTGPIVRVRRASDDAEQDFSATASGSVDAAAVATFCAAGDGFLTTLYDQKNARHLTQTTNAQQPKVVSSGVAETQNGNLTMLFDGATSSRRMQVLSSSGLFNYLHNGTSSTLYAVQSVVDDANSKRIIGNGTSSTDVGFFINVTSGEGLSVSVRGVNPSIPVSVNHDVPPAFGAASIATVFIDADNATAADRLASWKDGVLLTSDNAQTGAVSAGNANRNVFVGANSSGTNQLNGTICEIAIWSVDKTADQATFEGSASTYWGTP